MLHSFTPHTHDELSASNQVEVGIEAQSTNGFLSLLKDLFVQDLGQEHLEHFQNQDYDIHIIPPFLTEKALAMPTLIASETIEHHAVYLDIYYKTIHQSENQLRGPPSIG
jgi:hypothetical protein